MLFDYIKNSIKKNKELKESGKYVGIPLPFKRLSNFYPVLEKGHSIGILGGTGTGKSRLGRFMGVYNVYEFYKATGYKVRVFLFPLEDNKEKVYKSILCHWLYKEKNVRVSLQELDSKGDRALPQFVLDCIEEGKEYFAEFEEIVTVLDGYKEPKEIYKVLQDYALKTGTIEKYEVDIEGKKETQSIYKSDIHTIVIIDNMSNIDQSEEHGNERAAIVEMAKKYVRERLCNYFKFTVIQLLQLDFQSERQQFTSAGKAVMSKVEPTLAGIGDAKTIARSMHIIFSLFNPSAYEFLRYPQLGEKLAEKAYDIELLGNRFRALRIIKNNDGDMGMRVGVLMDAIAETFEELPQPESPEMKAIYNKLKDADPSKFIKSKNVIVYEPADIGDESPF